MKLSILICTLPKRIEMYNELIACLTKQIDLLPIDLINPIEIASCSNEFISIGEKRNLLLNEANGDYICFIDDDDMVSDDYILKILNALKSEPDCCSLNGIITFDSEKPKEFKHSIQYDAYSEDENYYYRFPNHLNAIKASICKQVKFPEINHGEDTSFATQIKNLDLLKKESTIEGIIYYYKYISNK